MTNDQKRAVKAIARIILDVVSQFDFAPASSIYLGLQGQGASVNQCNSIMSTLVSHGFLTHDSVNHTYSVTGKKL